MYSFNFDWVLKNKLAIGNAPADKENFKLLKSNGIKSILTLCDISEFNFTSKEFKEFYWKNIVLPDHTYQIKLSLKSLELALMYLDDLMRFGAVFVHCKAGLQRSPLLCMAWLIQNKNLSLDKALIYMMQVHPSSNPMKDHLEVLKRYSLM